VAVRSKAKVWSRLIAGIAGPNPAKRRDVRLVCRPELGCTATEKKTAILIVFIHYVKLRSLKFITMVFRDSAAAPRKTLHLHWKELLVNIDYEDNRHFLREPNTHKPTFWCM
jgi:hypothetical protein